MFAINFSCVTITCEQVFVILERQKKRKYNDGFKPTHSIKIIRAIHSIEKLDGGLQHPVEVQTEMKISNIHCNLMAYVILKRV